MFHCEILICVSSHRLSLITSFKTFIFCDLVFILVPTSYFYEKIRFYKTQFSYTELKLID